VGSNPTTPTTKASKSFSFFQPISRPRLLRASQHFDHGLIGQPGIALDGAAVGVSENGLDRAIVGPPALPHSVAAECRAPS
jgi:hypothetical protein